MPETLDLRVREARRKLIPLRAVEGEIGRYRSAREEDYSELVSEPCIVTENGRVTIVYLHLDKLGLRLDTLLERLKVMEYSVNQRVGGMDTTSRVFGFEPRKTLRKDFCSATSLATDDTASHDALVNGAGVCEHFYRMCNPQLYAKHLEAVHQEVLPEYWLNGGVFTSGIVNNNNPLPYHHDAGNFKEVWSAMLVFKTPGIEGGFLSCPEYGLGFALPDHSLFMFDGQGLLHGVTPIKRTAPEARRFSVVYYSLLQMWRCDTTVKELDRIKAVKTAREQRRAGLKPDLSVEDDDNGAEAAEHRQHSQHGEHGE